ENQPRTQQDARPPEQQAALAAFDRQADIVARVPVREAADADDRGCDKRKRPQGAGGRRANRIIAPRHDHLTTTVSTISFRSRFFSMSARVSQTGFRSFFANSSS